MTFELTLVLALLAGAILMFMLGRPRADAVGLLMMVALPLTGVISAREAVSGFANPNIILIAAMFVIGEGLARTGVAQRLGDWLVTRGGNRPARLVALLMLIVGSLGSVMYSTGVVAIFIPVALRIARNTGMSPAQVLMPVSYAALISGMLTLVAAAPNLIVNYELTRTGAEGLDFLALTPIGIPVLLLGMLYMMIASRWLGAEAKAGAQDAEHAKPRLGSWVEQYQLAERELRARVAPDSPAIGQSLAALGLTPDRGLRVIALERKRAYGGCAIGPDDETLLAAGDVLLLDRATSTATDDAQMQTRPLSGLALEPAAQQEAPRLSQSPPLPQCAELGLEPLPLSGLYFADRAQSIGMAEVILPAESRLLGKTLNEAGVQLERGLHAVGLRRGRSVLDAEARAETRLQAGDTLLLVGAWPAIEQLRGQDHDLVTTNLPKELDERLPAAKRAPYAVLALAVTVGLMVSELLPAMHAALVGVLLMLLFRCIDLDNAYRAISLRTLVLIAGMLPFGMALERTGGIELAADALVGVLGAASPYLVLATVYLMTLALGMFVVPAATAVLMAPLAMALAAEIGASPYPFAIAVALAASSAFMTPVVPANAMVGTLGGYRFGDYAKMGLPLVLLVFTLTLTLLPWLYPFY
ncbi:MAG: SLC13 family permease [Lamprobacter sp.]|uniref:SLC13 family permease n=1 Tax=Lamprobacter sp. TaxID=3100796 RepID=UPI002B25C38D|nr:SLC13 family permease [Lamprobacter sp.]MEA3640642.1 SLC13 family permease [Lamprobacter sp.]